MSVYELWKEVERRGSSQRVIFEAASEAAVASPPRVGRAVSLDSWRCCERAVCPCARLSVVRPRVPCVNIKGLFDTHATSPPELHSTPCGRGGRAQMGFAFLYMRAGGLKGGAEPVTHLVKTPWWLTPAADWSCETAA